jgi:hypothetical protein
MSLLTPNPVSLEGGDGILGRGVAALDPFVYQKPRWCANCGGEQTFFPVYEIEQGLVGFCFGCGEERIAPFTRMNSEAA